MTRVTTASIAYMATQVRSLPTYRSDTHTDHPIYESASLRPIIVICILQIRYLDGFRTVLRHCIGILGPSRGEGGCRRVAELVELVHSHSMPHSFMFLMFNSQVFPSYVTRERAVTKQSALAKLQERRAAKRARTA
jgi:hypothetical protein